MKTALIFAVLIILGVILTRSFIFPNLTVIHFENKSDKFIDSAIIHIQNYEVKVLNIAPQAKISKEVSKDSIALNNHDITIRIEIFDKSKTQFDGGLYYNDLSGLPNSHGGTDRNTPQSRNKRDSSPWQGSASVHTAGRRPAYLHQLNGVYVS